MVVEGRREEEYLSEFYCLSHGEESWQEDPAEGLLLYRVNQFARLLSSVIGQTHSQSHPPNDSLSIT